MVKKSSISKSFQTLPVSICCWINCRQMLIGFDCLTAMVSAIKAMGFRVTLWIHPFINYGKLCDTFVNRIPIRSESLLNVASLLHMQDVNYLPLPLTMSTLSKIKKEKLQLHRGGQVQMQE